MRLILDDLQFPEAPLARPDGTVLCVEVRRGTLVGRTPQGERRVYAQLGGGPNGAAIGPDGACYICNNGGLNWGRRGAWVLPHGTPDDYSGGSIQRVDLQTGAFDVLYASCGGQPLRGPNDLVFDGHGGFWFTDHGKGRARETDRGSVYYARADGSAIREVIFPLTTPNGIGLSPDGGTLYVSETETARVWAWRVAEPGVIDPYPWPQSPNGGRLLHGASQYLRFDSLAVEASGAICVATIIRAGITVIPADGGPADFVPIEGETYVTNLCFGGSDLQTAFVTLSGNGQLVAMDWPRRGLALAHA